jgi:hypothetical protein
MSLFSELYGMRNAAGRKKFDEDLRASQKSGATVFKAIGIIFLILLAIGIAINF